MPKLLFTLCLISLSTGAFSQHKMLGLDSLVDTKDPAWSIVQRWITTAKNKVQVLPVDSLEAKAALYQLQISTYSTLGGVVFNTGGILIDSGWVRILGSGNERLTRTVPGWNKGKTLKTFGDEPGFLLVADDAVGGFFAINYGALGKDLKNLYYLAPNSLNWEPLGTGYGEFLLFCFNSNLSKFYKDLRWATWSEFISKLDGNKVYSFRPYLWAKDRKPIDECTRKLVDVEAMYKFNIAKHEELTKNKENAN
ncbi:Zn-finger protein [Pedobacter sp. UYP30]|uniref:DUF2625 domain-containing protein n=1 Tax=Pedobacter sp. UYP30 TaxID=1756400 RepID=UPI00339B1EB2